MKVGDFVPGMMYTSVFGHMTTPILVVAVFPSPPGISMVTLVGDEVYTSSPLRMDDPMFSEVICGDSE